MDLSCLLLVVVPYHVVIMFLNLYPNGSINLTSSYDGWMEEVFSYTANGNQPLTCSINAGSEPPRKKVLCILLR